MKYWVKNAIPICFLLSLSSLHCQELNYKVYGELFQQKSKLYQDWLEQIGLGPELSLETIDFTSGDVTLYLSFGDRSIDSIQRFWLTKKERLEKKNSIPIEYILFGKMLKLFEIPASKARLEIHDTYNLSANKDPSFVQKIWFENDRLFVDGTSFYKRVLSPLNLKDSMVFSLTSNEYRQWLSKIPNYGLSFNLNSSYYKGDVLIDIFIQSDTNIIKSFENFKRFQINYKSNYLFSFEEMLLYKASSVFRQSLNKYKISIKSVKNRNNEVISFLNISFTDNINITKGKTRPVKVGTPDTVDMLLLPNNTNSRKKIFVAKKLVNNKIYNLFCIETGRLNSITNDIETLEKPVANVSWLDAVAFCNWLSMKRNFKGAYSMINGITSIDSTANGYRLPFERELESSVLNKTTNTNSYFLEWCNDAYFESTTNKSSLIQYNPLNYRDYRTLLLDQKTTSQQYIKMGGRPFSTYDDVGFRVVRHFLIR